MNNNKILEAIDTVCLDCLENTLENPSVCDSCPVRKLADSINGTTKSDNTLERCGVIKKNVVVSVDTNTARIMLRMAGFYTNDKTAEELFNMVLELIECYGAATMIKEN